MLAREYSAKENYRTPGGLHHITMPKRAGLYLIERQTCRMNVAQREIAQHWRASNNKQISQSICDTKDAIDNPDDGDVDLLQRP